jgi:hypothetical protein
MTDKPILFSAPMVRALLEGRKTQTRRLLPNPEYYGCPTGDCPHNRQDECDRAMRENTAADLRFAVGDRLYVREEWRIGSKYDAVKPVDLAPRTMTVLYGAGGQSCNHLDGSGWRNVENPPEGMPNWAGRRRAGMHMPRWASRLTLTVTEVRVERLQDCSEADALAEGIGQFGRFFGLPDADWDEGELSAVAAYHRLWNSINGPGSWEANPWVVAVTFTVEKRNIDA